MAKGKILTSVNLNDRQVGFLVRADQLGGVLVGFAVELHLNLAGLVNYVIIREDITGLVENHAGTEATLGVRMRLAAAPG